MTVLLNATLGPPRDRTATYRTRGNDPCTDTTQQKMFTGMEHDFSRILVTLFASNTYKDNIALCRSIFDNMSQYISRSLGK